MSADERTLDRRELFKLLGGGVVILFPLGGAQLCAQDRRRRRGYPEDPDAYLRIGEDGRVACFTGKVEMGQGIITSLAQMLSDELDVPLAVVDMVMGDTALCPHDAGTFGSRSTKYFGPALRQAAAEARAVLIELASERLGVPRERLETRAGQVHVADEPARSVSYAELTRGQRIARRAAGARPKARTELRVAGRDAARTDARAKVTGEARYAADMRVPGMLCARILRPPFHGAAREHLDTSAARAIAGVRIVEDGDLVAALHEHPDVAERALEKIVARFGEPENHLDESRIFAHLRSAAPRPQVVVSKGAIETGREHATRHFEASYRNHYVAHAPLEPHAALVAPGDGTATAWVSTQSPFRARDEIARVLGLTPEKVRVITPFVGGGFGGKTRNPQAVEAARLTRLTGRAVQVAWTRREEFFLDTFRPAALIEMQTGIDAEGRMAYWRYDNYFAGTRSSQPIYAIPHQRVLSRGGRGANAHPFRTGAWRGPGSNTNVFAMESQVDLMAAAAGMDPLAFRLANLENARMRRVLAAAAECFGESWEKAPSGRGFGLACTDYLGTHVATMAAVEVDAEDRVRVRRVVCAQDTGEVINPRGARLQIEGGLVMGLGYALTEQIRFRDGAIRDDNFDTYQIPRFSWLPAIEVALVDNAELPPQGCGEPAITTVGAALANAVHDAIGARLFELPMTPDRIRRARG